MSLSFLATYGTLMRPFGCLEELGLEAQVTFRSRCRFEGEMYDLGAFPGAVPGSDRLHGELFHLGSPRVLEVLDEYEGYFPDREEASLFVRRPVLLQRPAQEAWVYWYNGDPVDLPRVRSGDWAAYSLES